MNRREFITAVGAVAAVAVVGLPDLPYDDAAFFQECIDRGVPIPAGTYHIRSVVDASGRTCLLFKSIVHFYDHGSIDLRGARDDSKIQWNHFYGCGGPSFRLN